MKVYMGRYGKRYSGHRVFAFLEKYMSEERFDKFCDYVDWVFHYTINKITDSDGRKIKIKIHDYDTWNMDTTLSHIIVPMLIQLKKTTHGSPAVDDEDVPDELKSTSAPPKKNDWDVDDNHHKRWEYVLDEMIYAFTQIRDEHPGESAYYGAAVKHTIGDGSEGGGLVSNLPTVTDKEGLDKYYARIQKGTLLFGKYYSGLWD